MNLDDEQLLVTIAADSETITEGELHSASHRRDGARADRRGVGKRQWRRDVRNRAPPVSCWRPGLPPRKLTIATAGDDVARSGGTVTVTVKGGDGYQTGTPVSAAVTVSDDDLAGLVVGGR